MLYNDKNDGEFIRRKKNIYNRFTVGQEFWNVLKEKKEGICIKKERILKLAKYENRHFVFIILNWPI